MIKKFIKTSFNLTRRNIATDSPVFIFAASWRTGSTLLQRVINASGSIFIWGEPAFLSDINKLHAKIYDHLKKVEWNQKAGFSNKVGNWAPIVSPSPKYAKESMISLFSTLYGTEARKLGFERWGFKEVRPDAVDNMQFLASIYPKAKFIFLVRNPYDMYRSVKGKKFFHTFKDPYQPVKVWRDNVKAYFDSGNVQYKCMLVRYEDLIEVTPENRNLLDKIANHLEIPVTDKIYHELGAIADSSKSDSELTSENVSAISYLTGEVINLLDYEIQ